MVWVDPDGVTMVSDCGDGKWTVAVEPDGVTTSTDELEIGTVVVVVPPDEVKTCETVGELWIETVVVPPDEVNSETYDGYEVKYDEAETSGDGLTKADDETTTGLPDSVTTGAVVAGVSMMTEPPDGVV
jgi:hypothetical protein